eukprot:scaffold79523_cov47-Attheya_sp.AAC.1
MLQRPEHTIVALKRRHESISVSCRQETMLILPSLPLVALIVLRFVYPKAHLCIQSVALSTPGSSACRKVAPTSQVVPAEQVPVSRHLLSTGVAPSFPLPKVLVKSGVARAYTG